MIVCRNNIVFLIFRTLILNLDNPTFYINFLSLLFQVGSNGWSCLTLWIPHSTTWPCHKSNQAEKWPTAPSIPRRSSIQFGINLTHANDNKGRSESGIIWVSGSAGPNQQGRDNDALDFAAL